MERVETRYGGLFRCTEPGCTMQCWDGPTSTPADKETRQARIRAHEVFDRVWKSGLMRRRQAYAWLDDVLCKPIGGAHIGMATIRECQKIEEAVGDRWPELLE